MSKIIGKLKLKATFKHLKVYACPFNCRRKFYSPADLNQHLTLTHTDLEGYKIKYTKRGRAYLSRKL